MTKLSLFDILSGGGKSVIDIDNTGLQIELRRENNSITIEVIKDNHKPMELSEATIKARRVG